MIQHLLEAPMPGVDRHHIRLSYSETMEEVGRFTFTKVVKLGHVVLRAVWALLRLRPDVVYYPPAGPMWTPVIRDIAMLLAIRPLARKLVFHFHAAGVSTLWTRKIVFRPLAWLFRSAYFGVDLAIMLSPANPDDGGVLRAQRSVYIPYGIEDHQSAYVAGMNRRGQAPLRVLFVGALMEAKGVFVLTQAATLLWAEGAEFTLDFMGSSNLATRRMIQRQAGRYADRLAFLGVRTGDEKWEAYAGADIFCFPTHFEAEALPVVCLEAMMFGLPIVATRWRGVPAMVSDGETGMLVRTESSEDLSAALERLLADEDLRAAMGARGRARYEEEFTLQQYVAAVREELFRAAS